MSSKKISGSQRRKLNKEKQEQQDKVMQNVPKLETFFKKIDNNQSVTVPSSTINEDSLMEVESRYQKEQYNKENKNFVSFIIPLVPLVE